MRFLLFPLALLFDLITTIRNFLFDKGFLKCYSSKLKTIVIGNLQVGGTGKTPHTALFYDWFKSEYNIAILSRGYGRKSKGLVLADDKSSAQTIGDEAFWYYNNLKSAKVVVSESRTNGLKFLEQGPSELVLLDDAFQHRKIKGHVNIVLSDFGLLYYNDWLMPVGRLRESRRGVKRANIIIITKCPIDLTATQKQEIIQKINPQVHQKVFFSSIEYSEIYPLKGHRALKELPFQQIFGLSSIAKPELFIKELKKIKASVVELKYNDHHDYSINDIQNIINRLKDNDVIITTEKDAVKLQEQNIYQLLPENKVYVLPIKTNILFNEGIELKAFIENMI